MPRNKGKSHTSSDTAVGNVDDKLLKRVSRTQRPQVKGVHPTPATLDKSVTSTIGSHPASVMNTSAEVVKDPSAHAHQFAEHLQNTVASDITSGAIHHTQGTLSEKKKHRQEMETLLKNPGPTPQEKLKDKKKKKKKNLNKNKDAQPDVQEHKKEVDDKDPQKLKDDAASDKQQQLQLQQESQLPIAVQDQRHILQSHLDATIPREARPQQQLRLSERLDDKDKPGVSEERVTDQQVKPPLQEHDKGYVGFVPSLQGEHKDNMTQQPEKQISQEQQQSQVFQQPKQSEKHSISEDKTDLSQQNDLGSSVPYTSEEIEPLLGNKLNMTNYSSLNKETTSVEQETSAPDQKDVSHQSSSSQEKDQDKVDNPVADKRQQETDVLPSVRSSETQSISRPSGAHVPDKQHDEHQQDKLHHMKHLGMHRKVEEGISGIAPKLHEGNKKSTDESQGSSLNQTQLKEDAQKQEQLSSISEDVSKAPMKSNPLQRENIQNKDINTQNRESNRPEQFHQAQHQKGKHVHEHQPGQVQSSQLPDITELQRTQGDQEQIKLHDQYHEAIYGSLMKPSQTEFESQQPTQPQQSQLRSEKRQA